MQKNHAIPSVWFTYLCFMNRIVLIGYMASGKSSIGKKLAKKLHFDFVDTDQWIQEKEQKTIAEIFETAGESYFRALEQEAVNMLKDAENTVISTGGGLPCFNNNMDLLLNIGTCIYLKRDVNDLVNRIINSKTERPLANGKSNEELKSFVAEQLELREEFYKRAHFTADRTVQNHNQLIRFLATKSLDLLPK